MYYLAQSGAVFEDPIKADPNWPRVLVIDPEDRAQAEAFARAYVDVVSVAAGATAWEKRTQSSRDVLLDSVQAAFRAMLVEPPKVYAHYPVRRLNGSATETALCGKTWMAGDTPQVAERCPDCVAMVEAGWVS